MKKTIAISVLALTTTVNAQIKVFPGGLQSYGSTTSPTGSIKHRFSGDVVIGQVAGSTESAYLRGNNTTSTASSPDYTWLSNTNTGIFHPGNNIIGFTIGGNEKMRIDANGNVAIGIASTTDKLHVNGTSRLAGGVRFDAWTDALIDWTGPSGSAVIYPDADWYLQLGKSTNYLGDAFITHIFTRQSIVYTSDQSVKQNLNYNLTTVTSKLKQLKPVSYNFNSNLSQGAPASVKASISSAKEYGFIAQELMLVFPEMVEKDPSTGLYGVKYTELIPLLVDGFNAQQNTIDSLKQQINDCCSKPTGGKTNRTMNTTTDGSSSEDTQSYMKQNRPNPFNKETVIEYNIVESGNSSILVFDMNGKLLKTIPVKIPGKGSITISANDFQPGMYYYTLIVNDVEIDTKKMILTQ